MKSKHHFIAINVYGWRTTTDEFTLPDLIHFFESQKRQYALYFIPLPHDSTYNIIDDYRPDVEGTIKLRDIYDDKFSDKY